MKPQHLIAITGDVVIHRLLQQVGGDLTSLDLAWMWGEGLTCGEVAHPGGAAFNVCLVERALSHRRCTAGREDARSS